MFAKNRFLTSDRNIKRLCFLKNVFKYCFSTSRSIESVANDIKDKKIHNVIVVSGAGLSTASGVPDFRTPGSGLYDNFSSYNVPYPEAIFEISYFLQNPKPFFSIAKHLCNVGQYKPNYAHYFTSLLHEKKILLRQYTQNIDGLERLSGIPDHKLVEAHGSFNTSTCVSCKHKYNDSIIKEAITTDKVPFCKQPGCKGIIKPDIVFFGENLSQKFFAYVNDLQICDLILVIGTSLEVYPVANIVEEANPNVPKVLFNRYVVGPFTMNMPNNIIVQGDLIEGLKLFVKELGWQDELSDLIREKSSSN